MDIWYRPLFSFFFFTFTFLHHLCTIPNIGTLMRFSGIASQLVFGGERWLPFCGMYFHSDGKCFQKHCLHPDVWYLVADSPLVEWWKIFPGAMLAPPVSGRESVSVSPGRKLKKAAATESTPFSTRSLVVPISICDTLVAHFDLNEGGKES